MDFKLLSLIFCILLVCVHANFAVGRISTRPSAGKRSLRSFPSKYAIIRTAYKNSDICSIENMVEIREQMNELRGRLQELQFQYDTCVEQH